MSEIRRAGPHEAGAISALIVPLVEKFIAHEFTDQGRETLLASMTPEAIAAYVKAGHKFYVADQEGRLVGVGATRDDSHLFHLFVIEPMQGQGIGSRIWQLAKEDCLAAGNPGKFTVNASLNAVDFYRGLGFAPVREVNEDGVRFIAMKLEA